LNHSAQNFVKTWLNRGDEKSDTQSFWTSLLRDVYGIEHPESFIQFEQRVKLKNVSFIDASIVSGGPARGADVFRPGVRLGKLPDGDLRLDSPFGKRRFARARQGPDVPLGRFAGSGFHLAVSVVRTAPLKGGPLKTAPQFKASPFRGGGPKGRWGRVEAA